jgi:hypothetical protein
MNLPVKSSIRNIQLKGLQQIQYRKIAKSGIGRTNIKRLLRQTQDN